MKKIFTQWEQACAGKFCNVKIELLDGMLTAHASILAISSKVFRESFKEFPDDREFIFKLNFPTAAVKPFLEYLYTKQITCIETSSAADLIQVIALGHAYDCKGVQNICASQLQAKATSDERQELVKKIKECCSEQLKLVLLEWTETDPSLHKAFCRGLYGISEENFNHLIALSEPSTKRSLKQPYELLIK